MIISIILLHPEHSSTPPKSLRIRYMKLEKVGKPQVQTNRVDEQRQEFQGSKEKAEVFLNLLSCWLWITTLFLIIWCICASDYLRWATYLAAPVHKDIYVYGT